MSKIEGEDIYYSDMVKKLSIFLVLAIIVLMGVIYVGFNKKTINNEAKNSSKESVTDNGLDILVYPTQGETSFKTTSDSPFQAITEVPTRVPNKAIVRTATGTAVVLLPDNSSISLEAYTEITINYSPQKISIFQSLGTTYHRVEALITGASYQVQTPGTLAAVRGTKFAVSYDEKIKKTKIAVTEHSVDVTRTSQGQSPDVSTSTKEETVSVGEGKTVSVDIKGSEGVAKKPLAIIETFKDVEMKKVVDKQKEEDKVFDTYKKEVKDKPKEELRKIIQEMIEEKVDFERPKAVNKKEGESPVVSKEEKETVKTEIVKTQQGDDTASEPVVKKPVEEIQKPSEAITKISEEEFFTKFESLFIKYFYLDDANTPCTVKVSKEERVRAVTEYARVSGYPFTKSTLASFSEELERYCTSLDKTLKSKLQSRFDDEYPF